MTRDEAILQMLKQCGQRQGSTTAQADAITELVNTQNRLERGDVQPWFLLSLYVDAAFKTAVGSDTVALPATFLREVDDSVTDVGSLWYESSAGVWSIIYKEDYAIAQRQYGSSAAGAPKRYCLLGSNIMLFPAASEVWNLRLLAAFAQASLAGTYGGTGSATENNWLKYAPDWMIAETGARLASAYFRDDGGAVVFDKHAAQAKARVYTETIARLEAGMLRAVGV